MTTQLNQKINHQDRVYPVILQREADGRYTVFNPAFEGCYSQGDSIEDALENIKEATELCIEEAKENDELPQSEDISVHLIHA